MKFFFTLAILVLIPVILCAFLLAAVLPLFIQHFFTKKSANNTLVYPYLTSWEEAA